MTKYDQFEVKLSAFSVGLGQIIMAFTIWFGPDDSIFMQSLESAGISDWWGFVMLAVGSTVAFASVRPMRALRHHMLIASMIVLWVTFVSFVLWGRITLPSTLILWMSFMALASLQVDVCGNARQRERESNAASSGA